MVYREFAIADVFDFDNAAFISVRRNIQRRNFVLQNLVFLMQQTSENEDVFLQIIEQILYE